MAAKKKTAEVVVDGGALASTSLVPVQPGDLEHEVQESKEVLEMVKEYQIVTQPDMDFANECLVEIKTKLKGLKARKEEATKPLNAALKVVRSWFSPVEDFYGQAEAIWKDKMGKWHLAEAEKQRQALAAVQAAHAAGDVQGVATAMATAAQATVEIPRNITVKEVWNFVVTDPAAVPREYCSPDVAKIAAVVEALGDKANIPGVSVSLGTQVIARSA